MKKSERQRHIQEIISNQYVERQEDLVKLLAKSGIRVTQATISRDIKDMQLLKVPSVGGTTACQPGVKTIKKNGWQT